MSMESEMKIRIKCIVVYFVLSILYLVIYFVRYNCLNTDYIILASVGLSAYILVLIADIKIKKRKKHRTD